MRIFVAEYVTGGGFAGTPIPPGLCREGEMMLRALLADLAAIAGVELSVSRDARLDPTGIPGRIVAVGAQSPWDVWAAEIAAADAVWPIAPESGGILARLSDMAAGKTLLATPPDLVRLCASKSGTAAHLSAHAIPAVPCWAPGREPQSSAAGWIVKPDDGAGAEGVRFFTDPAAALAAVRRAPGLILQPFLPGAPESLSLLCRGGSAVLLACNRQIIDARGGEFRYRGFVVGGAEEKRDHYAPLAAAIARALPGLFGHVGVDLIATAAGPVVLEINPRLTTSYAGLTEALGANPAAMVLALAAGGDLPRITPARPVSLSLVPAA